MTDWNAKNSTVTLIKLLRSPFVESVRPVVQPEELLQLFDVAFKNRVALLLLEHYKDILGGGELLERYTHLLDRQQRTRSVISRIANVLNQFDPTCYVIFKSIKPYPATPNDTDVLFFHEKHQYEQAYQLLLDSGYRFHEWAPQQRTVYDPEGIGKIGLGKKGGTYYIDFYQEISTDYFAYFNKEKLKPYVFSKQIEGVHVNLLRPEPELAIVLFHNVFPERTFQLEHFYVTLYALASERFDVNIFIEFVKQYNMVHAVRTNFTLFALLHRRFFSNVPESVTRVLNALGTNDGEVQRFELHGGTAPYLFSQRTFWLIEVMRSLRRRLSERGVYHAE
jgi:hypothetical protein